MSVFSWERVQQEHVWNCDRIRCHWCHLPKATRGTLGLNNRAYCWLQHWRTHTLGTRGVSPHRVLGLTVGLRLVLGDFGVIQGSGVFSGLGVICRWGVLGHKAESGRKGRRGCNVAGGPGMPS